MPGDSEKIADKISKYVSNLDQDVYTVSNLPEEVVAVIFAYVSRSPKGFRENIETVITEEQLGRERAAKFHEKWVLNYGHASVAEHATVHVGVEKVSRLFSSLLELSDEFLSFTEYSQRYQKPERGDYFIPPVLDDHPTLKNEYQALNEFLYDTYSELNTRLFDYLKREFPTPEGKKESVHHRALEKVAFEDARYALSLAMHTNLGMTGNARAMENAISVLLSSKYSEARRRAEEIKKEVRFSVPTLIKYADEKPYISETRSELESDFSNLTVENEKGRLNGGGINIVDFTGKGQPEPEEEAAGKIAHSIILGHSNLSSSYIASLLEKKNESELMEIFRKSINRLEKFDNPLSALKAVSYEVEFLISEACWHQLLRHRKVSWTPQEPTVSIGVEIPPNIKSSGAENLLREAIERSEELYGKLVSKGLGEAASYVVTNAHLRRVHGRFDLWELYHLINLRMSEGAQWDIKNIIRLLTEEIQKHHRSLIKPALDRVEETSS